MVGFNGAWTGGKQGADQVWRWMEGTEMKAIDWRGEIAGAGDCAVMALGPLWHKYDCDGFRFRIACQAKSHILTGKANKTLEFKIGQPPLPGFHVWYRNWVPSNQLLDS